MKIITIFAPTLAKLDQQIEWLRTLGAKTLGPYGDGYDESSNEAFFTQDVLLP